jgi:hypothetical protein
MKTSRKEGKGLLGDGDDDTAPDEAA